MAEMHWLVRVGLVGNNVSAHPVPGYLPMQRACQYTYAHARCMGLAKLSPAAGIACTLWFSLPP